MYVEGLSEAEQYRYILMSIDAKNDWTHEREWRWANWRGRSAEDSILPIWNVQQISPDQEHQFGFEPIVIIVHTTDEAQILGKLLLNHFDNNLNDLVCDVMELLPIGY